MFGNFILGKPFSLMKQVLFIFLISFCTTLFAVSDKNEGNVTVTEYSEKEELREQFSRLHKGYGTAPYETLDSLEFIIFKSRQYKDDKLLASSLNLKGAVNFQLGRYELSQYAYNEAIELFMKMGDKKWVAHLQNNLGGLYTRKLEFEKALNCFEGALMIGEELDDQNIMVSTYINLGAFYHGSLEDNEQALAYFIMAEKISLEYNLSEDLNHSYVNQCIVLNILGRQEEALVVAKKALTLSDESGNLKHRAGALEVIGQIYGSKGEYELGIHALKESIHIREESGEVMEMAYVYEHLAHLFLNKGDLENFFFHDSLAFESHLSTGNIPGQMNIYLSRYEYFKKEGDPEKALYFFEKYDHLDDSLELRDQRLKTEEIVSQFESNEKDKEILELTHAKEKESVINQFIIGSIGLILILVIIGTFRQRSLHKRQKEVFEKKAEFLRLESALKEEEIQKNRKEILRFTSNIIEKNQVISNLQQQFIKAIPTIDEADLNEIKEELANRKILTESDWEEYKALFKKAYPNILSKIRNEYPSISSSEERLFILLKLEMDSVKIAEVLGISIDSVRKSKYRLKKRINLSNEISLRTFVREFNP